MDTASMMPLVAQLTSDLQISEASEVEKLVDAQRDIAQALLSGQEPQSIASDLSPPEFSNTAPHELAKLIEADRQHASAGFQVYRRDYSELPFGPGANPRLGHGLQPVKTHGPFSDHLGQPVQFDVVNDETYTPLNIGLGGDPIMFLSSPEIRGPNPFVSFLRPGTIRVRASYLVANVSRNYYFKLNILSGTVQRPPISSIARSVEVKLAPPDPSVENPAGISIKTPEVARFEYVAVDNQPSGKLTVLGAGAFDAFGSHFEVTYAGGVATYDRPRNRINFPLKCDALVFKPASNVFQLTNFTGQSNIQSVAWSLALVYEIPPAFRAASDTSAYAMFLGTGLSATIEGQKNPADCGECMLLVERGGCYIDGVAGTTSREPQILTLGSVEGPGSQPGTNRKSFISLRSLAPLTFTFLAVRNTQEIWRSRVMMSASLDQPRTINNHRVPFNRMADLRFTRDLQQKTTQVALTSVVLEQFAAATEAVDFQINFSFALKNAIVFTRNPSRFVLLGQYSQGVVTEGSAVMLFPLRRTMPFLPDPYATNMAFFIESHFSSFDTARTTSSWAPSKAMAFDINLGQTPFENLETIVAVGETQAEQPVYTPAFKNKESGLLGFEDSEWVSDQSRKSAPMLLDLSSNVAQFGVMFPTTAQNLAVADLMLQAPARQLQVVTLPAVSWEPVREEKRILFSRDPGPVSRFVSQSPTNMTPISPKEALGSLIANYSASTPVSARISLPFGMVGLIDTTFVPGFSRTTVNQVQPEFNSSVPAEQSQAVMRGVDQISLQRYQNFPIIPFPTQPSAEVTDSPSFQGATALLKTWRQSPAAPTVQTPMIDILNEGVSTAVSTTFSREMAEKVPLTRIDITGYGESTFSDWRYLPRFTAQNPSGTGISKVAFQVMNGRAARETVQLNTTMVPFAIKLVRQVDIVRLNNGVVIRRRSGWQATTEGRYRYDQPNIYSYPGLVLRATKVTNIRDVTNVLVKYDCVLVIDDPNAPNGEREIPARDQIGYVFVGTETSPPVIDPAAVNNVLIANKLGGELDFVLEIGKSTQKMRVTSLTVSPARAMGVIALWGSLLFEGDGQWSMTRQVMGVDDFPKPVDGVRGVPLIRDGRHDTDLRNRTFPYLFREPAELFDEPPRTIYGIVHGAPSYRVLFQQPRVDAALTTDALPAIITQSVKVADKYALAKAEGIFPDLKSCLPVGDDTVKQALQVVGGHYKFLPNPMSLANNAARLIKTDKAFSSLVSTIGDTTIPGGDIIDPATMNLAINTAEKLSKLDIKNLALETLNGEGKVVSKVVSSLQDEASKIGDMLDVKHLYGPALEQVRKVVSFLEKLKILPNFKVTMTNAWGTEMSSTMTRKELLEKLPDAARPAVEKIIEQFDFSIKLRITLAEFQFTMHIKVTVKVPSGFGPVALGVGGFDVALGTTGTSLSLELGCGIGVDFQVGPFKASASYAQSQTIMVRPDGWGVGVTATLRANVDLIVASANLFLEAKLLLVGGGCKLLEHESQQHGDTIYAYAQVRICLEVSIFLIIHVKVDEETHWENKLNSGKCMMDNMIDLQ